MPLPQAIGRALREAVVYRYRFFNASLSVGAGSRINPSAQIVAPAGHPVKLGARSVVHRGVIIHPYTGSVTVGEDVTIMPYAVLHGHGGLAIGDRTMIAAHAVLVAANHDISGRGRIRDQGDVTKGGISVGADAWIASHAVVLDGVRIGDGAVVSAGAVVTRDVEPFHVVAGVPARVIRVR